MKTTLAVIAFVVAALLIVVLTYKAGQDARDDGCRLILVGRVAMKDCE